MGNGPAGLFGYRQMFSHERKNVMQRSEQIEALTAALSKAQAEIEGAAKTAENPHFRNRYADLGAVWEAIRAPLTKHGLSVVQFPRACEMGVEVETTLLHTSGQFMSDTLALPVLKRDAQGFGSAITYARRYSLMAVAGIAPVDDDGNAAVGNKDGVQPLGNGKPRNDFGAGESWEEWAKGGEGSKCEAWVKKTKQDIASMVSVEDIDRFVRMETLGAKQLRALHDHNEKWYDRMMTIINAKRDELAAQQGRAA
jgi:hypothetical protein